MLDRSSFWKKVSSGLAPEEKILVAVSGGADSVALLHLCLPPKEMISRLLIGHVHHGTGEFADKSERLVRKLADELHVKCTVAHVVVPHGERKKIGFEAAAREVRYAALEKMADEHNCIRCLTGHTLDDQAESFLLAGMRGAGTAGLSGARARRGRWMRPLLSVRHEELCNHLREWNIQWVEDPTNVGDLITRTAIRNRLKPLILERFGAGSWENIAQSAAYAADAEDVLEQAARDGLASVHRGSTHRWIAVDAPSLAGYFADTRNRVLMLAWCHAADIEAENAYLSRTARKQLNVALTSRPGDRFVVQGVECRHTETRLVLNGLHDIEPLPVACPGTVLLPDGGSVAIELLAADDVDSLPSVPGEVEFLDADQLGSTLTIRPWQEGDRYNPLGRPDSNVKVTRALRRKSGERIGVLWVLLKNDGSIAMVAGERIADHVRVRAETRTLAKVTITPPPMQTVE
ncbi:tRNA lysidine(34) synthetase TilS [bacterium]|nr:tRNA lysidine(34) synthetase TilS [bacterium]